MAINSTLGAGMVQVASNAILADSIARQASALANARDSLHDMADYASRLEGNVKQLHQIVIRSSELVDALKEDLEAVTEQRDKLARRNSELEEEIRQYRANDIAQYEKFQRQVQYMRDLKIRLAQTEKALKHSSSRSVGLENLQYYLVQVTAALENHSGITEEAKDIMERAYDQFMESGQLSPDPEMQKILDELKIKAPDFKQGLAN